MKKFLFILLIGMINLSVLAQDSVSNPKMLVRPYLESGVDFIRSNQLKSNYQTKTKFFWGGGVQIGLPENKRIIPYVGVAFSKFEKEEKIDQNKVLDSLLSSQMISGGLVVPIKKYKDICIRSKFGYSYAKIKESFNKIDDPSHGFQIGIGVEKIVFRHSRIYIDLTYNYQKTKKNNFRDFDMTKLSIGIVI